MEFFCFEKGAMSLEKGLQKVEYVFKHSRVLLGTKPSKLFAVNKYYVPMQRVIICNISVKLPQHLLEKIAMLLQTVQNVCQSSKAFLWKIIIYIYIYICTFENSRVSWQICEASLQESVTWVYSRFHWWCNSAWEHCDTTSAECTIIFMQHVFQKEQQFCNKSVSKRAHHEIRKWSFSKNLCECKPFVWKMHLFA